MNELNTELTPPGYWGTASSEIRIYESILNKEENQEIYRYSQCNDDWHGVDGDLYWAEKVHKDITENHTKQIIDTLSQKIRNIMSLDMKIKTKTASIPIVRWRLGDWQAPHADKQELDGSTNCCPNYDVSSIYYINDDYLGGEIHFPNQSIQIKPQKNTLVIFPGDVFYTHGVTEVTKGTRYTVPIFWKVTEILS